MMTDQRQRTMMLAIMLCGVLVIGLLVMAIPAGTVIAQTDPQVVVIVADDFSGQALDELDTEQYDSDANCAVSLESQAFAIRGVAADPIEALHGDLVFAQLDALIDASSASDAIELVEVDIQGLTTDTVATRIQDAIDANPAEHHVINMSFVIIPCDYVTAFADLEAQLMDARESGNPGNYRSLFQRSVVFYDDTVFPVMSQRAQEETDLDPLQSLFTDLRGSVIPVASAGNFGLDFPFWPGAWGQVISVSASDGTGYAAPAAWDKKDDSPLLGAENINPGRTVRISNYGEVMMPGEYEVDEGMLSGTSFAAPRLSAALALYLAESGAYCQQDDGDPAFAYGDWDNLTLDEAVSEHCADMAAYLP